MPSMSAVARLEKDLVAELTGLARAYSESQAFVALLAHEVRTRLKITERALAGTDDGGARIAVENTRALQEIVEDLLELARARPDARADDAEAMRLVASCPERAASTRCPSCARSLPKPG
jgi:signal transduction histidine kinase